MTTNARGSIDPLDRSLSHIPVLRDTRTPVHRLSRGLHWLTQLEGFSRQAARQATLAVRRPAVPSFSRGGIESEPRCAWQLCVTPHPPEGGFGGQVT